MKISKVLVLIILVLFAVSCSSAPKTDQTNSAKNKAASLSVTAEGYTKAGDYSAALTYYKMALEMNLSIDNRLGVAANYNSLGMASLSLGNQTQALEYLQKALSIAKTIKDSNLTVQSLANLADYNLRQGNTNAAGDLLKTAFAAKDNKVQKSTEALLHHNNATWLKALEQYKDAETSVLLAIKINGGLKLYRELGSNYYLLSSLYSKQGQTQKAIEYLLTALDHDKKGENKPGIGEDLYALGLLYQKNSDDTAALDAWERAYGVFLHGNIANGTLKTLASLIELTARMGLTSESIKYQSAYNLLKSTL